LPVMLKAPGPGMSAARSMAMLPVCGMQNTAARDEACGLWSRRLPPGVPACLMHCAAGLPKAPLVRCAMGFGGDGQKLPPVPVSVGLPVLSGLMLTARGALKLPGAGMQSWVVSKVLVPAEHANPALAP
jgi:hypothetical protein